MHWLPLVAMVIASALPFPHNPVSRIAAATTEPGFGERREHRQDAAAPPAVDYSFNGSASPSDYNMAAALSRHAGAPDLQTPEDFVKETSTFTVEHRDRTRRSQSNSGESRLDVPAGGGGGGGGTLRTEDLSEDNSLPTDYKSDSSSSSKGYSSFVDVSKKENFQDSTVRPLQVSAVGNQDAVTPAAAVKVPETTTAPSQQLGDAADDQRTLEGLSEEGLEAGPGLDGFREGDEMFLDAHPRVLFSPSPTPPEHPPLLLMLESGLLEEEDGEDQEDADGRIEGHGDRAIDRSAVPSYADVVRPVKRNKRSHLNDRRRGEKSVCESESVWVTDKKTAIDSYGKTVTILQEIQTQAGPLKQYFFETRCRQAEQPSGAGRSKGAAAAGKTTETGVAGAGCLGVDKKQWRSECKARESFVRALTKDANNRTGWRWIRIDSSCVCVLLSRANQPVGREILMGRGRG